MIMRTTSLDGVYLIEPNRFVDERGYFSELYNKEYFDTMGIKHDFVQDNCSVSKKGVLRGLHFQINKPQAKLVRVTKGAIYDVAVDLRKNSDTFGKWIGVELSEENNMMLYIPTGLAHGFYTLSDATVNYKCSEFRYPEYERSLRYDDPDINIMWPLSGDLIMSSKDKNAMTFNCALMSDQLF